MIFVSIFSGEENQLQFRKKWENFQFFPSLSLPKKPERRKIDVIFSFKRSLLNPRTNYETMDCAFVLGCEK